jgi:hypothetical protein
MANSEKLLVHPFINSDSVFFGRTNLNDNNFIELSQDQVSELKYPFQFDDESVTFIDVGTKTY